VRAMSSIGRIHSFGCSRVAVSPVSASEEFLRAFRIGLSIAAGCLLLLSLSCNTYNPYLGATPTVSSSISSISPSGASAISNHADVLLTVNGSGFVAGSNVTWNNSGSASTNLVSNFVSASEMQANIPGSLLSSPGTFFVGVIAPGPTSGNNAGNNISNFVPFTVFAGSSSAVPTVNRRALAASPDASERISVRIQTAARYQPIIADSADSAFETATGIPAIFLRDTCLTATAACTPKIIPISVGWNGAEPNGASSSPSVTADGRFVVFASEATNLVKGDSNGWSDVFLRDTCIGAASDCAPGTVRLSIGADGAEANGPSSAPAISPDGRFVAFNSSATNLVRLNLSNALPALSGSPLFLRDTCFGAASGCVPTTSRVIPASALQH
jgi:WD40-like Beta Propeller Repeat